MIGLSEQALTWAAKLKAERAEHRAKGLPVIWYASIDRYAAQDDDEFLIWEGYYTTQEKAEAALAEARSDVNPEWTAGPFFFVDGGATSYAAGIKHILVD